MIEHPGNAVSCNTLATGDGPRLFPAEGVSPRARQTLPTPTPGVGVSELILTDRSPDVSLLLGPMLSHLSQTADRWVTWIGPGLPTRKVLKAYGVNLGKLRVLPVDCSEDNRWILWEALHNGTSHTVIAMNQSRSEKDMQILDLAATSGRCQAVLISSVPTRNH